MSAAPTRPQPTVAVVIPAFNEQETVGDVVRAALTLTPEVVVASDGSADATAQVARTAGARVVELLHRHGLDAIDLTDNEMAKLHVRHLVGGRAPAAVNEVLYRCEFPERPGALMQFLQSMSRGWNISLFHYRNHGADYGRVLVGIQVPEKEKPAFQKFLDGLGYRYWDESRNPAYKLFLG